MCSWSDAGVKFVQASRHASQESVTHRRNRVERGLEPGAFQHRERHRYVGRHRGVSRRGIEEGELAEVVTGFEARNVSALRKCKRQERANGESHGLDVDGAPDRR